MMYERPKRPARHAQVSTAGRRLDERTLPVSKSASGPGTGLGGKPSPTTGAMATVATARVNHAVRQPSGPAQARTDGTPSPAMISPAPLPACMTPLASPLLLAGRRATSPRVCTYTIAAATPARHWATAASEALSATPVHARLIATA